MDEISVKLTILFEDPFWIGLYERIYKNKLEVCKITFGKEPTDGEVYELMLKNCMNLNQKEYENTKLFSYSFLNS